MAGIFLDLASNAVKTAGNTFGTPVSVTGGLTGVDFVDVVGNMCSAMLTSTAVSGAGTADVKIQESTDNSTFTDISGAVFTQVAAANALQLISFQVTKRYLRGYATVGGTSVTLQLTFLGQRATTPANNGGWVNEAGGS